MFNINDLVVYGKIGVCEIIEITKPDLDGLDRDRTYYVLRPSDGKSIIYAPVDTKVFMRPIITAEEAERLIDNIPAVQSPAYYSDRMQELTQHYEAALRNHECSGLIELAMSIYAKRQSAGKNNKKFGQIDEKYMRQAEDLLYGEFSLALGILKDKVPEYIESRVGSFNT
jgi:CarD family transcriptional regulator